MTIFIKGNADIVDATLSRSSGGAKLNEGVEELIRKAYPDVQVSVQSEPSSGFGDLRSELESGDATMISVGPTIVILSLADDIRALGSRGATPDEAVNNVRSDLVAVIDLIKDKVGAHVLLATASTLDPSHEVFNYHGLDEEPLSLRAHRLDRLAVEVSHDDGISVVDVDRKIAELGGATGVAAALDYTAAGCEVIAGEIVRIIEDYGFFDERPLLAQVGARGAGK
jgi:hypothetical protein